MLPSKIPPNPPFSKGGITETNARQTALRLLARREHSRFELRKKLIEREIALDIIEPLLTQLVTQGVLSDQRFVENYIRARVNKGYGPVRIAAELNQRGITADLIDELLDPHAELWLEKINSVKHKRFGKIIPKDFNERAKQMRFLQYRGFTIEQIQQIFRD